MKALVSERRGGEKQHRSRQRIGPERGGAMAGTMCMFAFAASKRRQRHAVNGQSAGGRGRGRGRGCKHKHKPKPNRQPVVTS